jgi:hypothetical protein
LIYLLWSRVVVVSNDVSSASNICPKLSSEEIQDFICDLSYLNSNDTQYDSTVISSSIAESLSDGNISLEYVKSALLPDCDKLYLHIDQISVLRETNPDIDFNDFLSSQFSSKTSNPENRVELEFILSSNTKTVVSRLLGEALQLEFEYLNSLKDCRRKDSKRGQQIIPDYLSFHPESQDIIQDSVIKTASEKLVRFQSIVDYLFNLYKLKQSTLL